MYVFMNLCIIMRTALILGLTLFWLLTRQVKDLLLWPIFYVSLGRVQTASFGRTLNKLWQLVTFKRAP